MSTIPPASADRVEPHRHRQVAESFGADADRYDRVRPRYPDAMVRRVIASSPGMDVLDVGCGTGIAARQFQAAGCQVLGVDPDARMADVARQFAVEVEVTPFESWEPAGREYDTVIAGQAWHWVDPVAGAAKAAQALRQGGRLAVFWNSFQPPSDLAAAFAEVHDSVQHGLPFNPWTRPVIDSYLRMCGMAADGITQAGQFTDPEQWQFEWEHAYTRDQWLDMLPTHGGASQMPPATLAELLAGIGAAIDAVGGSFTMSYTTVVVTATTRCRT